MKKYLRFIGFCFTLMVIGFLAGSMSIDTPLIGYGLGIVFFFLIAYTSASVMKTYNELTRPDNYENCHEEYDIENNHRNGKVLEELEHEIKDEFHDEETTKN